MAFYADGSIVEAHTKTLKRFIKLLKIVGIYENNSWGAKLECVKRQKGLEG